MRIPLSLTEKGIEVVARVTCPGRKLSSTFNFLIDTGSDRSFLSWEDATKARIDPEELPRYPIPVAGLGGTTEAKHLNDPCFVHVQAEDGTLRTVELPDGMLVYRPARRKETRWVAGAAISLLGRDFLRESRWTLRVNLASGELYLEGL